MDNGEGILDVTAGAQVHEYKGEGSPCAKHQRHEVLSLKRSKACPFSEVALAPNGSLLSELPRFFEDEDEDSLPAIALRQGGTTSSRTI